MTEAAGAADPAADTEAESEEQPQPFQNRAARRSKGKGTATHTGGSAGRIQGRSGTVQSPRQYGNRRSG
ncbi:hypothetical protein AB0M02_25100 [Actinoplanes sp. NPDC051861]|uniref:hypothetical protein n=1 Tax=Actinoplanes sp. NPDC051861 TaxID=3155170 RepID=UPI003439522D